MAREKEQLLAEAKSEILRHEYRADLAENICELKRQIDSLAVETGHTRTGLNSPDENKLYFTKNWQIEREQEFRLEDFLIRKLVENHFEDVESVRSGQLFHVPIQPALFPLPREPGRFLSRD